MRYYSNRCQFQSFSAFY